MANQYNQQNPDGSWSQVTQNDNGTYTVVPIPPSGYAAANIPTGGSTSTSTGGQTYNTPNGSRTLDQMRSELASAGYNGAQDDASVIAAYNQTALGTSSSTSLGSSAQNLLDAIASGDQQKFDEAVREFNATNALAQTTQYGNLASNLLSTASNLRGPADYYQYWNYLNGGRDLFQTLYGNTPAPTFTAPYGTNTPVTLNGLLQSLGLAPATTATPSSPTTSPVSGTAAAVGATTTPTTSTPAVSDQVARAPASTVPTIDPFGNPLPPYTPPSTAPPPGEPTTAPYTVPTGAGGAPQAPNGYQVNPGTWDSLGTVGQALVLSSVAANGGDAQSWLAQLNASRPQGSAPSSSTTSFAPSGSGF